MYSSYLKHFYVAIAFVFITIGYAQTSLQFSEAENKWIHEHPVIKFGHDPEWPPYELFKNSEYQGITNEYLSIISKKTGIKFVPTRNFGKNETTLEDLLNHYKIDFIPCIVNTEGRRQQFLLSSSLASEPLVIATQMESEFVGGLADLRGKKVAIPYNYYTVELLKEDYPTIQIVQMKSIKECLLALSSGRVDATVEFLGVISYNVNHFGFTNIKIAAPTEYKNMELCMAFRKSSDTLHSIFQKAINAVTIKEHNRIRQKWIAVTYDHKNDYSKVFKFLKIIGAVLLGLLLLLFFWNRSLQKHVKQKKQSELKLLESLGQIKEQNEERKLLLKEIHHRVKNNLQIITSLLKLQKANDEEKNESFSIDKTIDRIRAIGLIHEKIYQSPNLSDTNIKEYITSLVETIIRSYSLNNKISVEYHIEPVKVDIENMVPLAIILNELVINSIKHGLKNKDSGIITIAFAKEASNYVLNYSDNGNWVSPISENRFGETLIDTFITQLDGTYTLTTHDKTNYRIILPASIIALRTSDFIEPV